MTLSELEKLPREITVNGEVYALRLIDWQTGNTQCPDKEKPDEEILWWLDPIYTNSY